MTQTPFHPTNRLVICPGCGQNSVFEPGNVYRPFCSERCKNADFGGWASGSFRMTDESTPFDKTPSESTQHLS